MVFEAAVAVAAAVVPATVESAFTSIVAISSLRISSKVT
jgi:hypothetical protein